MTNSKTSISIYKQMARLIVGNYTFKPKKKRPSVHAKTKTSKIKGSKNYAKSYRGQGR